MMLMAIERQFSDFCAAHGLTGADIVADGVIRRSDDPQGRGGNKLYWHVLFADGHAVGLLGHWREGWTKTWTPKVPANESERQLVNERLIEAQHKRMVQARLAQQDAAQKAMQVWGRAVPADPTHPYLIRKGIPPLNLRQSGDTLLVPLFDGADGRLMNLQRIQADGSKRFMPGARVKGCYWPVGDLKNRLFVCEGAATAVSLHFMTGEAVAAAMNAGNLVHVARALQHKHPDTELLIGADDDRLTPGNPGQKAARQAAAELGLQVASPVWPAGAPETLTDFNDLQQWRVKQ